VARYSVEQYIEFAELGILNLLAKEHAVLWAEAQAKISDVRWPSLPTPVDPHHMTTARANLLKRNRIVEMRASTRGGHQVSVLHLSDTKGIGTAIDRAAARKRALMATLTSWLHPRTGYPLGLVGAAGERVAHASLIAAAPGGLRLERPAGGDVANLLGEPVQGGPLDNAFWASIVNSVGLPVDTVLCPVEVKNIRHWVYPNADELHQLLHKSALLQILHPDLNICPVLITRKKSFSANAMSRELGFRILDVHKQFVLPIAEVDRAALEAMQTELGFIDLVAYDGIDDGLVKSLQSVANTAMANASRWRTYGPELVDHFEELRSGLSPAAEHTAMEELRDAVRQLGGDARW
jgi:hypothetical protein